MRRILVVAVACVLGCQSKSSAARQNFAKEYSCPEESVTVKDRPDLRPSQVFPYPFRSKPSAEVASDPVRLAKFNADAKESREKWDGFNDASKDIFEVTGCTHTSLWACSRGGKSGRASCEEAKKP
ncbi:MAG: hypothetical protein JWP87_4231 [Labilithrix sp.]|nr:hypothetical protein [Labilithrix sp.]